ncbi:uncharacterized protein LOC108628773 [Ceratina calcarata]|uniref:Uncharacterized protein LOC108628773 n=1 Tax=Ceratina calcarata TaxID=156304 RepID=A0AAJ7J858_9HYME|nr:uncharacterized protein LOC108628773 [Ceratina calcarata]
MCAQALIKKPRITSQLTNKYIGKEVILLGTVRNKSSNGKNLEILSTDGGAINVTIPEPIDGNVEGYIEVHGILQSRTTMNCSRYIIFPPEISNEFDESAYKEMATLISLLGDRV